MPKLSHHKIQQVTSGVGIICISYGLILERRNKFSYMYLSNMPQAKKLKELAINKISLNYGRLILVLGLIAEIVIQALVTTDHIIYTNGVEREVIRLFYVVESILMYVFIQYSYLILKHWCWIKK